MTTDTLIEPTSAWLPDRASTGLAGLVERVKPSVVQVRSERRGGGTGVVWGPGRVVTNHHVVVRSTAVRVELLDGRTLAAKVLASDEALDLALLDVPADGLPTVPTGDSTRLRVGELVVAVGHPWGQPWVVTAGIVSGIGTVEAPNGQSAPLIRSDVRLAPGNSGGPLLNASGEVVGINAMIMGGDLAVAIPSQVLSEWAGALGRGRARLGVGVQPVALPAAMQQQWAGQASGLLVASVTPDGVAARGGVLLGDVLLDLAGAALPDTATLQRLLGQRTDGETVRLHLLRGGAVQAIDLNVGTLERSA